MITSNAFLKKSNEGKKKVLSNNKEGFFFFLFFSRELFWFSNYIFFCARTPVLIFLSSRVLTEKIKFLQLVSEDLQRRFARLRQRR